jgi:hypothetical protein
MKTLLGIGALLFGLWTIISLFLIAVLADSIHGPECAVLTAIYFSICIFLTTAWYFTKEGT